ncbi:MAG: hypothetical protein RLZZ597_1653, partial [Cyanobacteriota bacterium]
QTWGRFYHNRIDLIGIRQGFASSDRRKLAGHPYALGTTRQKYPNICAILETSCQTGQGIEELRATITEEVGKLREVYNLLPLS